MKKNKKGFTLIELMIVVAIIGILAPIAIPSFLFFSARARQSEARTNLGAIYTAYTSYFSDYETYPDVGDIGGYDLGRGVTANCFNIANWQPSGTLRYGYVCNDTGIYCPPVVWPGPQPAAGACPSDCGGTGPATQTGFTVVACANIDSDMVADVWMVENNKRIMNVDLANAPDYPGISNSCSDVRVSDVAQACLVAQ